MTMLISNLTINEEFHLTGALHPARIEELLDSADKLKEIKDIDAHISEAMAQYPAEDFLESHKSRLLELHKNLRGANKETLGGIIEALDDLAQATFYSADYGRHELSKALKVLK